MIFGLAVSGLGAGVPLAVPAPPPVPLQVADVSTIDRNRNGIEDAIEDKVASGLAARGNPNANAVELAQAQAVLDERIAVVVDFAQPITRADLDQFVALGGEVTWIYQRVAYGWNGTIPRSSIAEVANSLRARLNCVVEAKLGRLHMHVSTRTGRVRQQWPLGYDGDPNITIAVLDTGVSGGHTDLTGRQQFWHDYTIDAAASPVDVIAHGSHVTGIALGSGAASGVNPGTLRYTEVNPSLLVELPAPSGGTGSPVFRWAANMVWSGGGSASMAFSIFEPDNDPATTANDINWWDLVPFFTSPTSPISANSDTDFPSGVPYPFVFHVPPATPGGFTIDTVLFQSYAFAPNKSDATTLTALNGHTFRAGDNFNLESGVAPACRWAGMKVFRNDGSGWGTEMGAGIDDLAVQAVANNIRVANMSFGMELPDTLIRTKANNAVNAGVFVAVSAGNGGPTPGVEQYPIPDPGRAGLVMTVAAASPLNRLSGYTSVGFGNGVIANGEDVMKPDIMAPGGSLYTGAILSVDSNDGDYSLADQVANDYTPELGTSMASPFVAGCAALLIDAWQQAGHTWSYASSADPLFIKMLLCATASESNQNREADPESGLAPVSNPTLGRGTTPKDTMEGYGMINVDAAIECLRRALFVKGPVNEALGPTRFDKRVSGFSVNLFAGFARTFNLVVPSGADFDLYLYSATPDARGNPVKVASANGTSTSGNTESFSYTPLAGAGGTYYLVVKRVSGSGTFTLSSPNIAPTLTTVNTLSGGIEDTPFTIPYANLAAAANEFDSNGDPISFRVQAVSSGTLTKNGVPVVAGTTLLSAGESLVWTPALNANGAAVNAFTVRAHDGTVASGTSIQVKVAVAAVNDAPVVTATGSNLAYNEQEAAKIVDSLLTVSDVDTASLPINSFATIWMSAGFESGKDTLTHTTTAGFSPTWDSVNGVLTLTATTAKTPANFQSVLRTVRFASTSDNPPASKAVSFRVTEYVSPTEQLPSLPGTRNIAVTAVADAPTLTTINPLAAAVKNLPYTITHALLSAAANEADPDSSPIYFRVGTVTSGTLTKNGVAVVANTTFIGPGEAFVWTPPANQLGTLNAFTVVARDGGGLVSTPARQVQVIVADTVIDITATDPVVTDIVGPAGGGGAGSWTVTRAGDVSQALTVNCSVSGTATVPDDYYPNIPTSTINFDPNVTSVLINLDVFYNWGYEPNEYLDMTILSGAGYTVGVSSARVGFYSLGNLVPISPDTLAIGYAVRPNSMVVGASFTSTASRAATWSMVDDTVWTNGSATALTVPAPIVSESVAYGAGANKMVGWGKDGSGNFVAFITDGTTPVALPGLGQPTRQAFAISGDDLWVVGSAKVSATDTHACVWDLTTGTPQVTDLGTHWDAVSYPNSVAVDVYDFAAIYVGRAWGPGGTRAMVWDFGFADELQLAGSDDNGEAHGINNNGVIVGTSWPSNGATRKRAVRWNSMFESPTILPLPTGIDSTYDTVALKINTPSIGSEVIVGYAYHPTTQITRAIVWIGGAAYQLDALAPYVNANYLIAYGVNDLGEVVGQMSNNGLIQAFFLRP